MSMELGAYGPGWGCTRNRTNPAISVVIPARNEAANLPAVIARLPRNIFEVILVDGHSTDGTVEVARELLPDLRVLHQQGRGKGDALAMGFHAVRGDIIVMLDADGSADAAEIPRFVAALVAGADFVKGSRFAQGGGSSDITTTRRIGNKALCALVNRTYGMVYTDLCYGYNAFWTDCLPLLQKAWPGSSVPPTSHAPYGTGFEIETMLNVRAAKAALTVWEVPSFERPRISGQSNLSAIRDGMRILRTIWQESPWQALRRDRAALAEAERSLAAFLVPAPSTESPELPDTAEKAPDTVQAVLNGAMLNDEGLREILPERVTLNGSRHAPTIPHTINGHGPATHPTLHGQAQ